MITRTDTTEMDSNMVKCRLFHFVFLLLGAFGLQSCIYYLTDQFVNGKKPAIERTDMRFSLSANNVTEGKFRTDGIYLRVYDTEKEWPLLFYNDGTYIKFNIDRDSITEKGVHDLDASIKKWGYRHSWDAWSGIFKVNGDTLYVNEYERYDVLGSLWRINKLKFVVSDKEQLILLDDRFPQPLVYRFVPCHNIPVAMPFVKKKKWMWETECDWRSYKDMMKCQRKGQKQK